MHETTKSSSVRRSESESDLSLTRLDASVAKDRRETDHEVVKAGSRGSKTHGWFVTKITDREVVADQASSSVSRFETGLRPFQGRRHLSWLSVGLRPTATFVDPCGIK